MATNLSSTGLEVAKVEQSDIATGGTDKVLLYASGSGSDTRLYVKSGADAQKQLGFDIDQFDALGGTGVAQGDHFIFSDAGTEKKITFSNMEDAIFGNVSGDATVAAGGALTIANDAVEQAMIADDAVGADQLASSAVVEASIVDNAVTLAKMAGITRGSIILGDSSGDPSLLAKGSAAQFLQSDGTDPSYVSISGDATVAAGGALTIGTGVVEHAMLAADCIDGDNIQDDVVNSEHLAAGAIDTEHLADNQVTLAKMAGLASAKFILGDSNGDPAAVTMSGDATMSNTGALTIAAQAVENSMLADDAVGADELAANAVVNASVVDGALKADKLDIDGSTDIGADLADADLMVVDDGAGGTNRKSALSRVKKYIYSAMSGDATASDTGALTIGANAVEGSMLNSNTAGDGLGYASNTLAVQVSGAVAITSDKVGISGSFAGAGLAYSGAVGAIGGLSLDIDNLSALGSAALHQTQDHFAFSDNGTEKKITFSNLQDAVFADVSGDATVAAGGALTIAADAVEGSMLNDNVISGQTELAHADIASADELMISDGGTLKKVGLDSLRDHYYGQVSGDATIADGGALTIAAQAVENSMLADDAVGADELAANAVVNASIASNAAIDMDKLDGGSLASSLSDLAQGDLMYAGDVDDSNNLKSITFSNLEDAIFGNVSGDATIAAGGALTIAAQAVENSMLADDAVGADELAANAVVNASVASNAAISLTKIDGNVDMGGDFVLGNQANDTLLISGPLKLGANTIADSGNNGAITLDGSGGFGTLGGFGGGSGVSFAASGGSQFATAVTVNKSDGSMANDFKVFGDTAGAHFMYDASADKGVYHNGSAQVMELGTSTNGFAIEVAQLSGDAGKIKATAFVTYSDESLKEEVTAMDNALNAVMSLNGVEFTWKNSGERDFGFLAQEVKNVIPQAVSVGNDGIHGVDYSRLTSVLVEAVKAQQVQIEELKAILKK